MFNIHVVEFTSNWAE